MKKVLSLVLCCLSISFVNAQQDKQFTQYMFNRTNFNPATTGFKGFCGALHYRNQWDRVQDAPNTTSFTAQGNLQNVTLGPGGIGVGVSVLNDAIGFQRNNTVVLNGAYHFPTPFGTLSGGLGLGIINVGFRPNWVPPTTDFDAVISQIENPIAATGFDANFGLYWTGKEGYYVGLSSTHLAPASLDKINFSIARHYYVLAGYNYDLGSALGTSKQLLLKPSFLLKADGATTVFDLSVLADYWISDQAYFWGGASYRLSDAIGLLIGYGFSPRQNKNKDLLKIGYSFDIVTNPLSAYSRGTHELMVNYCIFPPAPIVPRHGNPFILQ